MKFKIMEDKPTRITKKLFDQFVKENCNQFFKKSKGRPLFRGIFDVAYGVQRFINSPRKDRIPIDMPQDVQKTLDFYFFEKFGWEPRSSALFVTGAHAQAAEYGNIFKIYPTDGYKFLWSPSISDLFKEFHAEFGVAFIGNDTISAQKRKSKEQQILEFCIDSVDTYIDTNLLAAIKSGNEIMIQCKQYAAELDT